MSKTPKSNQTYNYKTHNNSTRKTNNNRRFANEKRIKIVMKYKGRFQTNKKILEFFTKRGSIFH